MGRIVVDYQRKFQVWQYTVSHHQLLLRSNKTSNDSSRVEVLFTNVLVINLPTLLHGMRISELTKEEATAQYSELISSLYMKDISIFIVGGEGYSGYVIASAVFMEEDQKDYDEPSAFNVPMMVFKFPDNT